MRFRPLITSNSIKWVHVSAKVQWGSVCSKVNDNIMHFEKHAERKHCSLLFSLGVLDLKRRSAEWSVYDISAARAIRKHPSALLWLSRYCDVFKSSTPSENKRKQCFLSEFVCGIFSTYSYITQMSITYIEMVIFEWMNEWCIYIALYYVLLYTQRLYKHVCVCVGGVSSTTTSVQHPLGWCDGCHRTTGKIIYFLINKTIYKL